MTGIDSDYPSSWPAVVTTSSCPRLEGTYRNYGAATFAPRSESQYLASRFGFTGLDVGERFLTVNLSLQDENTLKITIAREHTLLKETTISRLSGQWACNAGWMTFPAVEESDADPLGGYVANRSFAIGIATDGSLIGQERSGGLGLAFWAVPVAGNQTFWFLWSKER
ncbi:MAG: hypothetical protein U1F34_00540 [Gammaproteobacteria bacterium]